MYTCITVNGVTCNIPLDVYNKHFMLASVNNDRFIDINMYEIEVANPNITTKGLKVLEILFTLENKTRWTPTKEFGWCMEFVIAFIDKYIKHPLHFILERITVGDDLWSFVKLAVNGPDSFKDDEIAKLLITMHIDLPSIVGGLVKYIATDCYPRRYNEYKEIRYNISPNIQQYPSFKEIERCCYTPIKIICVGCQRSNIALALYQYLQYHCVYKGKIPYSIKLIAHNGFDYHALYTYILTTPHFYQLSSIRTVSIPDIDNMLTEFEIREKGLGNWYPLTNA